MADTKKVDLHAHCAPRRRELGRPNPRNPADSYIADPMELRSHLEAQGIRRAVIMSGGEDARADTPCVGNAECLSIAEAQPDFFSWMCNFEPVSPETVEDRMLKCKGLGAVGVGELSVNQWMDSPFLDALFGAAERCALPVTIHMSPEPGFSYGVCDKAGLPLLERTLKRFPRLNIIGHSQVFWTEISGGCEGLGNEERSAFGKGRVSAGGRVVRLMDVFPNLYGDLSAYSGSCAIMRDEEFGLWFLERFSDRLFFATDTANRQQSFPLGPFLDKARDEGRLSQAAWERICFGNARSLLGTGP